MNRGTITSLLIGITSGFGIEYITVFFINSIGITSYLFALSIGSLIQFLFYKQVFSFNIRNSGTTSSILFSTIFGSVFVSAFIKEKYIIFLAAIIFNMLYQKAMFEYERYYYNFAGNDKTSKRIKEFINAKIIGSTIAFFLAFNYLIFTKITSLLFVMASLTMINNNNKYEKIPIERNIPIKMNWLWFVDYIFFISLNLSTKVAPTLFYNYYGPRSVAAYTMIKSIIIANIIPWAIKRTKNTKTLSYSLLVSSIIIFLLRNPIITSFLIIILANYAIYSLRNFAIQKNNSHKPLEIEYSSNTGAKTSFLPIKMFGSLSPPQLGWFSTLFFTVSSIIVYALFKYKKDQFLYILK